MHLHQHAGLGRLDHAELAEVELVALDHLVDQQVAVVARLDAVDLAVQLVLELGDVLEALQTGLSRVGRHRQGVLGAFQVGGRQHLHAVVLGEGLDHCVHGGRPVAEEDVDLLVLHTGEGDGHRGHDLARGVAQAFGEHHGDAGSGGDVGPADLGEANLLAALRLLGPGTLGQCAGQQAQCSGFFNSFH
ncbi:hypothetical protein D3C72_1850590 [compost metagenome]